MLRLVWTSAVWRTAEFEEKLREFVAGAVGEPLRLEPLQVRPWLTRWRVVSGHGVHLVRQNCPGRAHEAALLVELSRHAPGRVVPVTAADCVRDLLLTPHLGPTVRRTGAATDPDAWGRILAAAGALQREVAPHVAALPLTVLLPGDATTYVADAVGRLGALPAGDPRRLGPERARRLEGLLPMIGEWSEEVADLDLPITLDHSLHGDKVVAATTATPLRFLGFEDAVLAQPLGALLVPLRACADALGARPDDPRLHRVVDAALEVWTDLVPARRLRAALPAALQLGRLARAESWRRCVATRTLAERGDFGGAPACWLGTLGDDLPVGTRPRM